MTTKQMNNSHIWRSYLPRPKKEGHKYDRGHLIVLGGTEMTGAARLASEAAMRIGCGLCTIVSSPDVKEIYLKGAPHVMFESYTSLECFSDHLSDPRRTAAVMGPGAGRDEELSLRSAVRRALATAKPIVLDADALTVFAGHQDKFFPLLHPQCVLTPHEGEFERLFPDMQGERIEKAAHAARISGAVVLLKGAETVIAHPDGRIVINDHSSPYLATAGAGDVLAGMIGGLLAQGMDAFLAACAAAWIHGEAGQRFGPGLVASDIIAMIPQIFRSFS